MKLLLLLVLATFGCVAGRVAKPTVGQEICATACQGIGGNYYHMSEEPRKCYCVFDMPEYRTERQQKPASTLGSLADGS